MQIPPLATTPVWVSEHYWPGLLDGVVLAQAQRTAMVHAPVTWLCTVVLADQQTAFGLFTADELSHIELALAVAGARADRLSAAVHFTAADVPLATSRRR